MPTFLQPSITDYSIFIRSYAREGPFSGGNFSLELGWREGQNVSVEYRWASMNIDDDRRLARSFSLVKWAIEGG